MDLRAIRAQDIADGIAKGEENATYKIAKNLLQCGVAIDLVMKSTNLTREEVEKIITKLY